MPAMSALPTFVDGTVVTPASLVSLSTNIEALAQIATGRTPGDMHAERPAAKVLLQNPHSVADDTVQAVAWDTVEYDTDFMFSLSDALPDDVPGETDGVTGTALIVVTPGWYRIEAQIAFDFGAASERLAQIRCIDSTGVRVAASSNTVMGNVLNRNNPVRIQVVAYEHLDQDNTIYCTAFQDSGVPLNALASTATTWGTWLAATWDAPY